MNYYYLFTKGDKWVRLEGSGSNPSQCTNVNWTQSKGNTDLDIIKDVVSDLHPGYGEVMDYKDNLHDLYVQSNLFGHFCKFGYTHKSNNFIPFKRNINIVIKKGERIINVKGSAKVKAHKRRIKIVNDLDRIGDKEKDVNGIVSTDHKESVKNVNDYISNLNQTDEGKKIMKSVNGYTLFNYSTINNYMKDPMVLNNSSKDTIENVKDSILNIKKFIKDAPKFEGKVYRGIQCPINGKESKRMWDSFIKNIEGSKEIKFKSFLSTTSEKMVALNFAQKQYGEKNSNSCLIEIKTKSGVAIESISQVPSEKEVLIDSNKTYKKIGLNNDNPNKIYLLLEEI